MRAWAWLGPPAPVHWPATVRPLPSATPSAATRRQARIPPPPPGLIPQAPGSPSQQKSMRLPQPAPAGRGVVPTRGAAGVARALPFALPFLGGASAAEREKRKQAVRAGHMRGQEGGLEGGGRAAPTGGGHTRVDVRTPCRTALTVPPLPLAGPAPRRL